MLTLCNGIKLKRYAGCALDKEAAVFRQWAKEAWNEPRWWALAKHGPVLEFMSPGAFYLGIYS